MGNKNCSSATTNLSESTITKDETGTSAFDLSQAVMRSHADRNYVPTFTNEQRKLIEKTWNRALNSNRDLGQEIFNRILAKSERIRKVFNLDSPEGKSAERRKYGRFVSHAGIVKVFLITF